MNKKNNDVVDFSKKKKEKSNQIQYLTFEIGNENYALKLVDNKEVIESPCITKVPNTDKYVKGVINLRGQIVPVIDLKIKLGLNGDDNKKDQDKHKKIIIVQINDVLVGINVNEVKDVVSIAAENIEEIAESKTGINQEFIRGVFTFEDDLVIILDIKEILFENEEKEVSNV